MNYFEACKFGELVKKCNGDKLKLLLGSPVNYLVRPAGINNIPLFNASLSQIKLYQDINYKFSAFGKDGWDVMAYASDSVKIKPATGLGLKRLPACYLSLLYYDDTITEKEICIKAMKEASDKGC